MASEAKQDREENRAHYGSVSGLLKKGVVSYLKGMDVMIRLFGSCVIVAILMALVWTMASGISMLPFVSLEGNQLAGIMGLVLLPMILRVGFLGGGFAVPPVLFRGKSDGGGLAINELTFEKESNLRR